MIFLGYLNSEEKKKTFQKKAQLINFGIGFIENWINREIRIK